MSTTITYSRHNLIDPERFKGGYLRVPIQFLKESLQEADQPLRPKEAYMQMMLHVQYAEQPVAVGEAQRVCRRGESYRSLQGWSELFHWTKMQTSRFFQRLEQQGLLECERLPCTTRIRMLHYDTFAGLPLYPDALSYTEAFDDFWILYHRTTRLLATDKQATYTIWRKLKESEREKATKNISKYFFSLAKTKYCVRALIYLRNKKFNDQFLPRC